MAIMKDFEIKKITINCLDGRETMSEKLTNLIKDNCPTGYHFKCPVLQICETEKTRCGPRDAINIWIAFEED